MSVSVVSPLQSRRRVPLEWLPLGFIMLALVSLLIVPRLVQRQMDDLRTRGYAHLAEEAIGPQDRSELGPEDSWSSRVPVRAPPGAPLTLDP